MVFINYIDKFFRFFHDYFVNIKCVYGLMVKSIFDSVGMVNW